MLACYVWVGREGARSQMGERTGGAEEFRRQWGERMRERGWEGRLEGRVRRKGAKGGCEGRERREGAEGAMEGREGRAGWWGGKKGGAGRERREGGKDEMEEGDCKVR